MQMTFKIDERFQDMVLAATYEPRGAYGEKLEPVPAANLYFVKDHGVYLMPGCEGNQSEYVVYAPGLDPDKNDGWYDRALRLGGEDFAENIQLPQEWVDRILDGRGVKLVLKVSPNSFKTELISKKGMS